MMTISGVLDLSDPDAVAEIESKDEGDGHLRSQICPEEEEEEKEEQVFEPLSTLTPHKTYQCHLTGKEGPQDIFKLYTHHPFRLFTIANNNDKREG